MPEPSSVSPGSFCWVDLATTDWQSAKRFYCALFGWEANEIPTGENAPPYVVLRKRGRDVAALYEQSVEQRRPGVPPAWLVHVAVTSADDSAARALDLGATVPVEPFDVLDAGQFALLHDPQGAAIALWQSKTHHAAPIDEPGSFCWSELHTPDPEGAQAFYTALFGWKAKESAEYVEWVNDGRPIGGMMKESDGAPPGWLVYFAVEDCDRTARRAEELGGTVQAGPEDIPDVGRFALIADPQGSAFAAIRLQG
ncbi:MAG TPA: VOC family protein [Thermoanaerobaculia bacterium]|nr:VOC family protein [Thermoanaerobaculia bacterium]